MSVWIFVQETQTGTMFRMNAPCLMQNECGIEIIFFNYWSEGAEGLGENYVMKYISTE